MIDTSYPCRRTRYTPRPGPTLAGARLATGLSLLLCGFAPTLGAQSVQVATVSNEENFRGSPNGLLLGRLNVGTELADAQSDGRWVEVTLEGWMWAQSLQVIDEGGFDLVISVDDGENLRSQPQGTILGRLEQSTYLEELERVPGWIRVRRRGFIWLPSVQLESRSASTSPAPATRRPAPTPDTWTEFAPGGGAILTAPDGDTLAVARGGSEVEVLGREGNWSRVRMEGWVWSPSTSEGEGEDAFGDEVMEDVPVGDIPDSPDEFRGRLLSLRLRFVSLERADRVRTDFYVGEPYLLARSLDDEEAFAYIAIPPERVEEAAGLIPLEEIRVVGRVRTASSTLTGAPILDLLELVRVGR